ncbi:MAG TPA: bifunctional DNA-formamidopyrimidine glycosylase/DNA-(apurinic or apyrimidinic site) lyase [Acidimicrobiales bacterium]|nr:bifunctional DNA-formamidopyrimidine glycosylase/DNA-(apurinic or apyrimidinic site) lyase [Acidimicrobiales bacterium]
MPELPEVETIRRDLEKEALGKRIKSVDVSGLRSIRRHSTKKQFTSRLEGQKIEAVSRRGKNLLIDVGDDLLVVHLGMSGQLLKVAVKDPTIKHTHVVITFTQGGQLRYVDTRTFGELFVVAKERLAEEWPELGELGFDPIEDVMSWNDFGSRLVARKAQLKAVLMDQKFVAGIGNIYSDEILWEAGLRYDRPSNTLSIQEVRRLYRAIGEVLNEAIKQRGSSLADETYRDLYGETGQMQLQHNVYARDGQPCKRCRHAIGKAKYAGRSTYYCPSCQV